MEIVGIIVAAWVGSNVAGLVVLLIIYLFKNVSTEHEIQSPLGTTPTRQLNQEAD
jgi:uncharacterized membrane protein